MGWIAKGKYNGKIYSKEFNSIYSCQNFIDTHLREEMKEATKEMNRIIYDKALKEGRVKHSKGRTYDEHTEDERFIIDVYIALNVRNNPILCYNVEQERFCEGFDF